jgi:hypothetical protein
MKMVGDYRLNLYVRAESRPGEMVAVVARDCIELAERLNAGVVTSFNGVELHARPDSEHAAVMAVYHRELELRAEESRRDENRRTSGVRELDLGCGTMPTEPTGGRLILTARSGDGIQCRIYLDRGEARRVAEALLEMTGGGPP